MMMNEVLSLVISLLGWTQFIIVLRRVLGVNVENSELFNAIKLDVWSLFDVDYIFEFGGSLFEKCPYGVYKYRVIFGIDEFDFVKDKELILKLNIAFLAQA